MPGVTELVARLLGGRRSSHHWGGRGTRTLEWEYECVSVCEGVLSTLSLWIKVAWLHVYIHVG